MCSRQSFKQIPNAKRHITQPMLYKPSTTLNLQIRALHLAVAALLILLSGCAGSSKPTHFYILNPITDVKPSSHRLADSPTIGVGPISLPNYLDRPEVVTRLGPNKVAVDEFNLWAGSLKDNLQVAITESLSLTVANNGVVPYPWRKSIGVTLQIGINIRRFDIEDSNAWLIADWSTGKTDELSKRSKHRSKISIPVSGFGVQAKIAALNLALDQFSKEIVSSIK